MIKKTCSAAFRKKFKKALTKSMSLSPLFFKFEIVNSEICSTISTGTGTFSRMTEISKLKQCRPYNLMSLLATASKLSNKKNSGSVLYQRPFFTKLMNILIPPIDTLLSVLFANPFTFYVTKELKF
ncbi:hypothetical protein MHBO_002631 [Bonamia ostreae]|uniref:Uncharacterized protein n=1 Tax=Bonamia ostreae TaxID=126728 RepID=A0ABV2AMZ1_9EUKA